MPQQRRPVGLTPGASPLRAGVERWAALPLVWLSMQPKLLVAAVPLILVILTVVLPGAWVLIPGLVLIAVVGLFSYLSWPVCSAGGRTARLVALTVLVVLVVSGA